MRVSFRARAVPLTPRAVLAEGEVVPRLLARLAERSDAELRELEGVRGEALIALLGAPQALPWCDGVVYFGSDGALGLLYPVNLEPDVPESWLAPALPGTGPRLVVPRPHGLTLIPLSLARPLAREHLGGA